MSLWGGVEIVGRPSLENVRRLDLLPIPAIRRCQRLGFAIDPDYFRALSSQFSREMEELEKDISSYIPPDRLHEFAEAGAEEEDEVDFNAGSPEQIAKLLFDVLGIGAGEQLKLTKSGKVSTDKKQLRDLELRHPVVGLVLQYRERAKLRNTYTMGLVKLAKFHPRSSACCPVCELPHAADTWRVHTEITTTRTETGRLASKKPNLQNIPQRTKLGAQVRAGFIASPGTRLVSVDFSQVELRMMAHLANCASMIAVYEADKDLHVVTAMECFGIEDEKKLDKISHRIPAKTANFLTQYGGSGKALYVQLMMAMHILISEGKLDKMPDWLSVQWCERFVEKWFNARPEVREYLELQAYRARRYGMAWDIFGRVRLVPEVRSCHKWIREAGVRQAGNLADQGSCAGLMKLAMAETDEYLGRVLEAGVWAFPLVPVHDQLISEVEEDAAEDVREETERVFNGSAGGGLRVPIKSDGEVLSRWEKG